MRLTYVAWSEYSSLAHSAHATATPQRERSGTIPTPSTLQTEAFPRCCALALVQLGRQSRELAQDVPHDVLRVCSKRVSRRATIIAKCLNLSRVYILVKG